MAESNDDFAARMALKRLPYHDCARCFEPTREVDGAHACEGIEAFQLAGYPATGCYDDMNLCKKCIRCDECERIRKERRAESEVVAKEYTEVRDLISAIVERAMWLGIDNGHELPQDELFMALTMAHEKSPLRLKDLLDAKDADFGHDVFGIAQHIDTQRGTLGSFLPRYAA